MRAIERQKQMEIQKNFINLGIVLNNNGEVLMIKRKKPETGKDGKVLLWAFPGGRQEEDEDRKNSVKREILAETGYDVEIVKQISLRFHPDLPVIVVYHLCKLVSPNQIKPPSETWEIEEIKWVKPEEVKSLITTSLDETVAKELRI